jgi:catalase
MPHRPLWLAALLVLGAAAPAPAQEVDPAAMVDAMQKLGGKHPGLRPSFAKGVCGEITFTPTAEAASLSKAATFAAPSRGVVRLAVAGSSLKASDKGRTARGMSMALDLPGGAEHHLVLSSAAVFIVNDPADFVPFLEARLPDPATGKPDPARIKAFGDAHPETLRQAAYLKDAPVPASFAHSPFFGVNTFIFEDAAGAKRPGRWIVEPQAGVVGLTPEQIEKGPDDYLVEELRGRLAKGPVAWDVFVQLPEPGDPLLDATLQWPAERKRIKMGAFTVTAIDAAGVSGPCQPMMFDPLVLPAGVEPSDDPVLLVRSPAYAVSLSRRLEN